MSIYIKGEQAEIFEIKIKDRLYPQNKDYWDGNFLVSIVKASVNGFNASLNCNLRTDELSQLLNSIELFLQNNSLTMSLKTMEENIEANGKFDGVGYVIWKVVLRSSEEYPSSLSFTIKSSIAEVENLKSGLKRLLSQYPIIGNPN
jgi:hypothetical protein